MVESHRAQKKEKILLMTNSAVILIPSVVTLTTPSCTYKNKCIFPSLFLFFFGGGENPQDRNQLNHSTLKKKKKSLPVISQKTITNFSFFFLSRGKREPDGAWNEIKVSSLVFNFLYVTPAFHGPKVMRKRMQQQQHDLIISDAYRRLQRKITSLPMTRNKRLVSQLFQSSCCAGFLSIKLFEKLFQKQ